MEILFSVIAGLAGTLLMTLFLDIVSILTGFTFHVPRLLGTMVAMRTMPSGKPSGSLPVRIAGIIIHYAIGVFFALAYRQIVDVAALPDSAANAAMLGLITGVLAMGFWYTLLKLHPLAPSVRLVLFLVLLFLGHFIFAAGMYLTYHFLAAVTA